MLVADPHMYVTEVKFYDQIHPNLRCETPEVYALALDEETSRFAVVIEDLSLRDAVFPSALSALTADDVAPLMSNLAKLHAPHWGRKDLEQVYPWLETATTGKSSEWWRDGARDVAQFELQQRYKLAALDVDHHPLDRVLEAVARLQVFNGVGPSTVIHGDTHVGNCYLLPGGGGGVLDWQLTRIGNWGNDVGYTLMTALDVEERRKGEEDLLRLYLDELRACWCRAPHVGRGVGALPAADGLGDHRLGGDAHSDVQRTAARRPDPPVRGGDRRPGHVRAARRVSPKGCT